MKTSLGKRLANLRKSKGFTQESAARALEIQRGTYSMYELDLREPDAKTLYRIAEVFDVTVDYLISGCSIGKQIQERRKELGFTVEQLAINAGVSEEVITRIEGMPGDGQIESPRLLALIAVELFTDPRDFIRNSKQIVRYKALEYIMSDGAFQDRIFDPYEDSLFVPVLPNESEFIDWVKQNISEDFFKGFQMSNDNETWKIGLQVVYEMQKRMIND